MTLWNVTSFTTPTPPRLEGQTWIKSRPYGYPNAYIFDVTTKHDTTLGFGITAAVFGTGGIINYLTPRFVGDTQRKGSFTLIFDHPNDAGYFGESPAAGYDSISFSFAEYSDAPSPTGGGSYHYARGAGAYVKPLPLVCQPILASLHVYLNGAHVRQDVDWRLDAANGQFTVTPLSAMQQRIGDRLEARYVCVPGTETT